MSVAPGEVLRGLVSLRGSRKVAYGTTQQFTVLQQQGGEVVGGSTYELRLNRARGLHPVSHVRVILEKVRILDDHDPCLASGIASNPCRCEQGERA